VAGELQTALRLYWGGGGGCARAESGGPWRLEVPCHRGQTHGGRSGARLLPGRDADAPCVHAPWFLRGRRGWRARAAGR
jgi:hypothetical protein